MKFLRRLKKIENWNKPFSERVAKRVSRIPTGELILWADQSLSDLGRCLSNYEKGKDRIYLEEALLGAEAIHAVVDELYNRMTTKAPL